MTEQVRFPYLLDVVADERGTHRALEEGQFINGIWPCKTCQNPPRTLQHSVIRALLSSWWRYSVNLRPGWCFPKQAFWRCLIRFRWFSSVLVFLRSGNLHAIESHQKVIYDDYLLFRYRLIIACTETLEGKSRLGMHKARVSKRHETWKETDIKNEPRR